MKGIIIVVVTLVGVCSNTFAGEAEAKAICQKSNSPTAKSNDPLLEIYCARLELAKTTLAKAKAEHVYAVATNERVHRATSSAAASIEEYERSKREKDVAAAMIDFAKAKIKESEGLVEHVDNLLKQNRSDIPF